MFFDPEIQNLESRQSIQLTIILGYFKPCLNFKRCLNLSFYCTFLQMISMCIAVGSINVLQPYSEPCQTFKMERFSKIVFRETLHPRYLLGFWIRLCYRWPNALSLYENRTFLFLLNILIWLKVFGCFLGDQKKTLRRMGKKNLVGDHSFSTFARYFNFLLAKSFAESLVNPWYIKDNLLLLRFRCRYTKLISSRSLK